MDEIEEYKRAAILRDNHLMVDDYEDLILAVTAMWGSDGGDLMIKLQNLKEAERIR